MSMATNDIQIGFMISVHGLPKIKMAYLEKKKLEEMTFTVAANKHLYTVRFEFVPGVDVRWS